jgi:hypothetical protein
MAKLLYTRSDIQTLADRLEQRAASIVLFDMPQLQRDMRAAAMLLRYMLVNGMPVSSAEIEVVTGK